MIPDKHNIDSESSSIFLSRFFIFLFLSVSLLSMPGCRSGGGSGTPDYISSLDSLIDHQSDFEREKLVKIADLRRKLNKSVSATERYSLNSLLFEEFSTYNSDSAMKYIDAGIDMAESAGNKEWLMQSLIRKAEIMNIP